MLRWAITLLKRHLLHNDPKPRVPRLRTIEREPAWTLLPYRIRRRFMVRLVRPSFALAHRQVPAIRPRRVLPK